VKQPLLRFKIQITGSQTQLRLMLMCLIKF